MSTASSDQQDVRIRRAPKYGRFMIVGGGIGALVTFILTVSFQVDPAIGFGALFGYFALFGVPAGIALGAIVALLIDRRSRKRAVEVRAEHESLAAAPEPSATTEPSGTSEAVEATGADEE